MRQNTTLVQEWTTMFHGYPIRVEVHQSDLAYVIEFYDANAPASAGCISHVPGSQEELSLDRLQAERAFAN